VNGSLTVEGSHVHRPHHRHRSVGPRTGGTTKTGSVEIHGIGNGIFGGS